MIGDGHPNILQYPFSFFLTAADEYVKLHTDRIKQIAIAVRGANSEKFDEFMDSLDGPSKKVDHARNLDILKQPL